MRQTAWGEHVPVLDPFTGRCETCGLAARDGRAEHVTLEVADLASRFRPHLCPWCGHVVHNLGGLCTCGCTEG